MTYHVMPSVPPIFYLIRLMGQYVSGIPMQSWLLGPYPTVECKTVVTGW